MTENLEEMLPSVPSRSTIVKNSETAPGEKLFKCQ